MAVMGAARWRCLVAAALVGAALPPPAAATALRPGPWTVVRVLDGDTIDARLGTARVRVRLAGIDAPELHDPAECFGVRARRALAAYAPSGARVLLRTDPRLADHDRYGRAIAYVLRNGTNVNVRMVRVGAAARGYWSLGRPTAAGALTRAEARALDLRRGAWGACPRARLDQDPRGPWETGGR